MSDLAEELAALVADTLAAADAWRATGASVAPAGPLEGLPPAEPWPAPAPGARGVAQRPGPAAPPPSAFQRPAAPRVDPPRVDPARVDPARPVARPEPARVEPPRPVARPEPPRAEPPPAALFGGSTPDAEPAAPAGLAGLFGSKWQVALRDRNVEITTLLGDLPPCPDCGAAPATLRGAGNVDARLVVVGSGPGGAALGAEGGAMLDRMLLNVLAVERADIYLVEANACAARGGGCRIPLRRQVDVVAPRLVLAMGPGAGTVLGGVPATRGEWAPWGSADVMPTFHPLELLQRPGDKRAAMEHLTTLRRRM